MNEEIHPPLPSKRQHIAAAIKYSAIALLYLIGRHYTVLSFSRTNYVDFHLSLPILLIVTFGPLYFMCPTSGYKKYIVQATIITSILAPLPFGPEGTLVPAGFGVFYPPLFLFYPQGILLTFVGAFALSLAAHNLWSAFKGNNPKEKSVESDT